MHTGHDTIHIMTPQEYNIWQQRITRKKVTLTVLHNNRDVCLVYVGFLACDHTAGHSYTCPYFHTTHIEVLATGEDLFTAVKRTQQYFFWVCFPVGGNADFQ